MKDTQTQEQRTPKTFPLSLDSAMMDELDGHAARNDRTRSREVENRLKDSLKRERHNKRRGMV